MCGAVRYYNISKIKNTEKSEGYQKDIKMKIGNLTLNGVAALAPMAGATDRPFRELCCSFGAAYCVTEMVSTRALQYNYKKTQELITLG